MHGNSYLRLGAMIVLSFISMYILMHAMVDSPTNIYNSFNQLYMAGLMTAPMVVIELLLMGAMYADRTLNITILGISILIGALCFAGIRQQSAISDVQFLRSMIPHHAGAVLMCQNGSSHRLEIKELCAEITSGQEKEIKQMKALLVQ